jgi:hypothetical protein
MIDRSLKLTSLSSVSSQYLFGKKMDCVVRQSIAIGKSLIFAALDFTMPSGKQVPEVCLFASYYVPTCKKPLTL